MRLRTHADDGSHRVRGGPPTGGTAADARCVRGGGAGGTAADARCVRGGGLVE